MLTYDQLLRVETIHETCKHQNTQKQNKRENHMKPNEIWIIRIGHPVMSGKKTIMKSISQNTVSFTQSEYRIFHSVRVSFAANEIQTIMLSIV